MINQTINLTDSLLNQLVELHINELHENDLSVALGPVFIKGFYQQLIYSPHGKIFVDIKDNNVRSLVCVFFDYTKFNQIYKKKFRFGLMLNCIWKPHLIIPLIRQLVSSLCVSVSCHDSHLGMIIIDSSIPRTPELVKTFRQNVKKGFDSLKDYGHSRVWGSTRYDNIPTINFLNKLEFFKTQECLGVIYFEKEL